MPEKNDENMSGRALASDPAGLSLSHAKLARFHPELFGARGILLGVYELFQRGFYAASYHLIRAGVQNGDSRAAIVVSTAPILVAAYSDEFDCVSLLRFPDEISNEHPLTKGGRLLTANTYWDRRSGFVIASDLTNGPRSLHNYINFTPLITEFLSDDLERIDKRKAEISEAEWERTAELAAEYVNRQGARARDGRPRFCTQSAELPIR